MQTGFRNDIKATIIREGLTMKEVLEQLHNEYGWSESIPNLSMKLARATIKYREVLELADIMGYDIVWRKRDNSQLKEDYQ